MVRISAKFFVEMIVSFGATGEPEVTASIFSFSSKLKCNDSNVHKTNIGKEMQFNNHLYIY